MINKDGERELAYVVKIDAIEPIEGSDNCEAADVGGWRVMVKKNTFKAGDLAIYFEIDSKVPNTEPFKFLEKKHFKIKSQKYTFGGKGNFLSQGLLMDFSDFPDLFFEDLATLNNLVWCYKKGVVNNDPATEVKVGDYMTKLLNVVYSVADDNRRKSKGPSKYERMYQRHLKLFKKFKFLRKIYSTKWGKRILFLFLGKKKDKRGWPVGRFPGVSKTDQERVENMIWVLEDKTPFIVTTKIDGTSCTYILEKKFFNHYEYYVCSRNVRMDDENQVNYHSEDENVYWQISKKFKIKEFLMKYIKDNNVDWVCLQGEGAGISEGGVGIQGNPHKMSTLRFFGFHLTDSVNGRIDILKAKKICNNANIEWVPIVNDNFILPDTIEEFKKQAEGDCEAPDSKGQREGYVYYKTTQPTFSFKNINNIYLLEH